MKDNGGTAFPCNSPDGIESYKGMSLRDYFAGQALAGLCANTNSNPDSKNALAFAKDAFALADAMLAEREKEK